jgi:hypothetical protein
MPEIYFHVGMGKVASTYLRTAFFPKLKDIFYIPRRDRHDAVDIISRNQHERYLLCRALDSNMAEGIKDMAAAFPGTRTIIVLRKPDSWLMSQYRRYVKNGFPGTLQEFMDVEDNKGFWDRSELLFMNKINLLENSFQHRPLVLFYEDMQKNPKGFFDDFVKYIGARYTFEDIQLSRVHSSHNEYGLVFRRSIRRRISDQMPKTTKIPVLHWIERRLRMLSSYALIWVGKSLPAGMRSNEAFVDKSYLEKVKMFAARDWLEVEVYADVSRKLYLRDDHG